MTLYLKSLVTPVLINLSISLSSVFLLEFQIPNEKLYINSQTGNLRFYLAYPGIRYFHYIKNIYIEYRYIDKKKWNNYLRLWLVCHNKNTVFFFFLVFVISLPGWLTTDCPCRVEFMSRLCKNIEMVNWLMAGNAAPSSQLLSQTNQPPLSPRPGDSRHTDTQRDRPPSGDPITSTASLSLSFSLTQTHTQTPNLNVYLCMHKCTPSRCCYTRVATTAVLRVGLSPPLPPLIPPLFIPSPALNSQTKH